MRDASILVVEGEGERLVGRLRQAVLVEGGVLGGDLAGGGVLRAAALDLLLLLRQPRVEVRPRHRVDVEVHLAVGEAAELRALAVVDARLGDGELEAVGMAGDQVAFEEELGDVQRVDDVLGLLVEVDRLADRQVDLRWFGGGALDGEVLRRLARVDPDLLTGVGELPLPLETGDVDGHRRVGRLGVDLVDHLVAEHEQHRHDDQRSQRPAELEQVVAVELRRQRVVPAPVAQHRPHDQALDQHEDHGGDDEQDHVQVVDRLGLLGGARVGTPCAAGQQQHAAQRQRDASDPGPRRSLLPPAHLD